MMAKVRKESKPIDDRDLNRLAKNIKPCQAQHVIQYELEGELTLYDPEAEVVHILNSTAAVVWQLCDGTRAAEDIAIQLATLYSLEAEAVVKDVEDVLAEFYKAGLLLKRLSVADQG